MRAPDVAADEPPPCPPPVAGAVIMTPNPATELTGIECVVGESSDPDGDNVALSYAWYVNDALVEGQTGATLSGEHYDKGDTVLCEVTAFDGEEASAPAATCGTGRTRPSGPGDTNGKCAVGAHHGSALPIVSANTSTSTSIERDDVKATRARTSRSPYPRAASCARILAVIMHCSDA